MVDAILDDDRSYLTVVCPVCHAGLGQECRGVDCDPGMPHGERWDLLEQQERAAIEAAVNKVLF